MRVKITLTQYHREQAVNMRLKRGLPVPENFEGPEFDSVKDVRSDPHYVLIMLESGDNYMYPHNSIDRVALYQ